MICSISHSWLVERLEKSVDHCSLGQTAKCSPQLSPGSLENPLPNSTPLVEESPSIPWQVVSTWWGV